jgi:uncharacterized protein YbaR (Trm112 family)
MPDIDGANDATRPVLDPAQTATPVVGERKVDPKLLEILVCPLTKTPLRFDRVALELISDQAGLAFPIRNGVPIMLVDEARILVDNPVLEGVASPARQLEKEQPE